MCSHPECARNGAWLLYAGHEDEDLPEADDDDDGDSGEEGDEDDENEDESDEEASAQNEISHRSGAAASRAGPAAGRVEQTGRDVQARKDELRPANTHKAYGGNNYASGPKRFCYYNYILTRQLPPVARAPRRYRP